MASSTAVVNIRNCTIVMRGGVQGQFINLRIGTGSVSYDEKLKMEYIMDRGILDTVRLGEDEPMDVKLDCQWIYITAASVDTIPTVEDVLKNRGPASTWSTSSSNPCEPYSIDLVIKDLPCSADQPETLIFPDFRYESINHDLKSSNLSIAGKCNSTQAIPSRGSLQSY